MTLLLIVAAVMVGAGLLALVPFVAWPRLRVGPRLEAATVRDEVAKHPRLLATLTTRLDPGALTGLALSVAAAVVIVGAAAFGLVLLMVESHTGIASLDVTVARFAATHATSTSTSVLRKFTQLGGAVVLAPLALVVWVTFGRRRGWLNSFLFLLLTVGGQFAVADIVKAIVGRTRPDFSRLTGFSGPSFPSGHATAAACCFAAFALLIGARRSTRVHAALAAAAVAIAAGIACTRVFLGVHWLTDVVGGLALGWAWFALCSLAFGGRLLRFGLPAEQAEAVVEADDQPADRIAPTGPHATAAR